MAYTVRYCVIANPSTCFYFILHSHCMQAVEHGSLHQTHAPTIATHVGHRLDYYRCICSTCYIIRVVAITHLSRVPYSGTLRGEYSSYATYSYTYNYVIDIHRSLQATT